MGSVMPRDVQASWLPISLQHGKGVEIDVLEFWERTFWSAFRSSLVKDAGEHIEDVQRKGLGGNCVVSALMRKERDRASCCVHIYLYVHTCIW